jgi:hypothetical protein
MTLTKSSTNYTIVDKIGDVNISGNYKEEITKVYELIFQLMKDIESKE